MPLRQLLFVTKMDLLDNIGPSRIKALSADELREAAREIRSEILKAVSSNGGHLASNLGVVELTLAIHRVFDLPRDKVIFDVGHQAYTHKILTGRRAALSTLRKYGGISGFEKMCESEYDAFGTGHSSTSLSAALGYAEAGRLRGSDAYTVVVAGDGAFTGGMLYEAMNNCNSKELRLIVILNDNEMSISPNVGALSRYFARVRVSSRYFNFKHGVKRFFGSVPLVGASLVRAGRYVKEMLKRLVTSENIFESLGLEYLGPVDGTDIQRLESVLKEAKTRSGPCLVHVRTKKGSGYPFAESQPDLYHSVGPFDVDKVVTVQKNGDKYCERFGAIIEDAAARDEKVIAITAAMCSGTGLDDFAGRYPDRFFDVGIAEEHAVTFAAGLAAAGMRPVFAVYSTFLQRSYDQLIHDVALQRLPVLLAVDHAGLVPGDGPTHHGVFDVAFLATVPGARVYSPETLEDMDIAFAMAFRETGLSAVRYPGGKCKEYENSFIRTGTLSVWDVGGFDVAMVTYGRITANVVAAARRLNERGIGVRVIKLLRVMPPDYDRLTTLFEGTSLVYVLEEGIRAGGVGERIAARFDGIRVRAIEDRFVPHGDLESLYRELGFLPEQIEDEIIGALAEKLGGAVT